MGVPGFFRWISKRYPLIRKNLGDPSRPVFNNLFIDANNIIYRAITSTNTTVCELTSDLLSEILRYLDLLVQVIEPTDLIFISFDGPPPASKTNQQRVHRYQNFLNPNSSSLNYSISPGTEFMYQIHLEIINFIKKQKVSDLKWATPKVIYSSAFTPGEGEHKIASYIRECRLDPDWNPNQVHCIYSSDCDLIFLALQTHEPYICILREADAANFQREFQSFEPKLSGMKWSRNDFELVHVSLIRDYLQIEFNTTGEELERIIDDYVALSFFIGNDFIPDVPEIDIKKYGFNDIIEVYQKVMKSSENYLVEDGTFNKEVLYNFVNEVVNFLRQKYASSEDINVGEEELKALYTEHNKQYILSKYPEHTEDFDEFIEKISKSFIEAITWVLKYYHSGCCSWNWYYQYHYSPPLEFILPYIKDYEPEFEEGIPRSPLQTLLAITTPKSYQLLPKSLQSYITDPESPIYSMYPTDFKVDQNGKKESWRATYLLPMIDFDLLDEVFKKCSSEFTDDEQLRDKSEYTFVFDESLEEDIILISPISPLQSVLLSTEIPSCIPTFNNTQITHDIRVVPIQMFGQVSNYPSMVITPNINQNYKDLKSVGSLINAQILFDWPYLCPGLVISAIDKDNILGNDRIIKPRPKSMQCSSLSIKTDLLRTLALDINDDNILLEVKPMNNNGTYQQKSLIIPIQLTLPIKSNEKILDNFKAPSEIILPNVGDKLVCIDGMAKGFVCVLEEILQNNLMKVNVLQQTYPFGMKKLFDEDKQHWVTTHDIVKAVGGISFRALRTAVTTVIVKPFNTNIAFALYNFNHQIIEGFCKLSHASANDYVYPASIVPLIVTYFQKAGNLKSLIMKSIQNGEKRFPPVTLEQLYGGDSQYQNEKFEDLQKWLTENSPASKSPLVSAAVDTVSPECLVGVEKMLIDFKSKVVNKSIEVDQRKLLWRQKPNPSPTAEMPPLGKRVISIASSGAATFGEMGTVIETNDVEDTLVVLFDHELTCGTRLEGRLKTNRGIRLNLEDVYVLANS
ncbi:XRN 5'-3' exonuclease N-terminus family protein [Histomonas meleagridis]|uniref:XRN 5'-3' exonuclease N-terminus family protein n=1 Tax=Histomonas meleagridis TaxID=135588 RepID=UPI00355AC0B4|nr:XRN 5'-3' exonuclease N-terminus family protein [Histomonas meleagridis]KAH0805260.1 XRN 5'-3' exonuclease N-terminus family protein [Histomonas meleagridis]